MADDAPRTTPAEEETSPLGSSILDPLSSILDPLSSTLPPGTVALVGAGPGNPGLLTLRAVECLAEADLVLYDRLVPVPLLDQAPANARRICVEELPGCHPDRLAGISQTMV